MVPDRPVAFGGITSSRRIGYRGLRSDKAGLDEAIEDLDGLLDPVDRARRAVPSRWIR